MTNNVALFGITRIDHKNTHSWWVRLKYVDKKPQIQKSFPDLKHGGRPQAFLLAVNYRDEQISLHKLTPLIRPLSWKGRTRKKMRMLQKRHKRGVIVVGTGIEGAKKAYDLGMSRHTCRKIRTGSQNWVMVNNGGWHTPEYEDFKFKHDITNKQYKEIRNLVEFYAREFSETEKSEIVSDIMIKLSIEVSRKTHPIEGVVRKWVRLRKLKKTVPYKKQIPLDINGDIERLDYDNQ